MRDAKYIADMRFEANVRRAQADNKDGLSRDHLLERAAFFDRCADEAQAELDAERAR